VLISGKQRRGERRQGRERSATSVGGAVTRFAVASVAAILVLGAVGVTIMRRTGTSEAIREAKQVTRLVGRGTVERRVTAAMVAGDPRAIRGLDRVIRSRVLRDPIVRVKIWTASGRIVYSDEPRLIGATYELGAGQRRALRTNELDADVSDLHELENRFERSHGKLLEVYMPIRAANGRPLLFEAYQRFSSISDSGRHLWLSFTPALLGALLVLGLLQLPLAWSMARRLRAGQEERETLLRKALEASDSERRRIARVLHDGVVQELAGVSYSLSAGAERAASNGDQSVEDALRSAATHTRASMRELRSLLVEIYPASLHQAGLEAALRDVLTPLERQGLQTGLVVDPELGLSETTEAQVFRAAREALRNVLVHADARRVDVGVTREDGVARLVVADDGRGFSADSLPQRREEGHLGLTLLADLAAEAGGSLDVDSAPGRGTRIEMTVPAG
jgi:two-component system, NarL family, sensor kinase